MTASDVPDDTLPEDKFERVELLCREAYALRFDDPIRMLEVSALAAAAAERLDPKLYPPERIADLASRAFAELGNAHRLAGDFPAAERALTRALRWFDRGTGDGLLLGWIAELAAVLRSHERRYADAYQLLDHAHAVYLDRGERHLAGQALVTKGLYVGYEGDPDGALRLILSGVGLIEPERDQALAFAAIHNLLWFLVERGRFEAARSALRDIRPLLLCLANGRLNEARLSWMEARIAAGLGERSLAERLYREVVQRFLEAEQAFPAALASLDLALLLAEEGRFGEIRTLALDAMATFQPLRVPEVLASFVLLEEASAQESREGIGRRIRDLARVLERARERRSERLRLPRA